MAGLDRLRGRRLAVMGAVAALGGSIASVGLMTTAAPPAGATPSCTGTTTVDCTFSYTGSADSFTVPNGVTLVTIDALGAQGGGGFGFSGGKGGEATATIPVTPGEALQVNVGGVGGKNGDNPAAGGFNGGASSGTGSGGQFGGTSAAGGGGASDVRRAGTDLAHRVVVAGGGGGAAYGAVDPATCPTGGDGGGTTGGTGSAGCPRPPGEGGTQSAGGAGGGDAAAGTLGSGGAGGNGSGPIAPTGGGGGGGGLYGGGGGSGGDFTSGPGGGGSGFTPTGTGMTNGVRSGNGQVTISYDKPTTPVVASAQFGVPNQTDVFSVAPNGEIDVRWVVGAGKWNGPLAISAPGLAERGSLLVASQQFGISNQTDVFVVDKIGTVEVLWVQGTGKWKGPLAISSPGLAMAGAHLAASNQFGLPNQTDVFVVDDHSTVQVLWVQGAGKWNGPLAASPTGFAPGGAGLAASNQFGIPNQTDVFVVDSTGTVDALWVQGAGKWNGPRAISPSGLAPEGAGLTSSRQFGIPNQTDVFVSDAGGTVDVLWVQGAGKWNGPLGIGPSGLAPAGAELSSSEQFGIPVSGAPIQTDVFVVDHTGTLQVVWVENAGKWNGPLAIGSSGLAVPGAGLASSNQFGIPNQTDVWQANVSGALQVFWVQNAGAWKGPLAI